MKARRYPLFAFLLVAVVAALFLFTPFGNGPLCAIFAVGDVERTDFDTIKLGDKTNQHLVCPPGYCGSEPHGFSPIFDIPLDGLRNSWRAFAAGRPRTEIIAESEDGLQVDYVQRSARFRFPDIVTVRFISLSPTQSTFAIFSRSIYGRSDFGVNRKRVERWLRIFRASP